MALPRSSSGGDGTATGTVHRRVSVDDLSWEEDVAVRGAEGDADGDGDDGAGTGVGGAYESPEEQLRYASESGLARAGRVLRAVLSPCLQLSLVYFLEYVVLVGFASKANPHPRDDDWWAKNAYELLALCYQIGVFFARSSVSIIQIRSEQTEANDNGSGSEGADHAWTGAMARAPGVRWPAPLGRPAVCSSRLLVVIALSVFVSAHVSLFAVASSC